MLSKQIGKPIVFKYIRAHMGDNADPNSRLAKQFAGSTTADTMAKGGSRQSDYPKVNQIVLDEEVPLWPLSEIKRRLFDKIKIEWKKRWNNNAEGSPRCKATKNFLPNPNTQFWKLLCSEKGNNRLFFSELVFCITNHNYLPAYEHKINPNIDKNCFLCNNEEAMDVHHLLWECPKTFNLRFECFHKLAVEKSASIMGAEYIYDVTAKQLESFLIGLRRLEFSWLQEATIQ